MNLIKELNKLADSGYCPALLFDDDGKWALSFELTVQVENKTGEKYIFHIDSDDWKDTIEEAVKYSIEKNGVNYK
jgi:hypothetical protein